MLTYENDFFQMFYKENDPYKDFIIDALNSKTKDIADFFGITKVDEKIKVIIYYSIDEFKNYLIPFLYDGKYYDWMIGSTHDGNINHLSLECCHQTETHSDRTLKQYIDGIIHEVVHKMHHLYRGEDETENAWFHESLATNLSNQDYKVVPITCTLEELKTDYNSVVNQYSISYTIGKYLLENYPHDFILSMCKDEKILDANAHKLFEETKKYAQNYFFISIRNNVK